MDISALVAWLAVRSPFGSLTSSATGSVFSCRPRVDSDESTGCTVFATWNMGRKLNDRKQYFSFKMDSESEKMLAIAFTVRQRQHIVPSSAYVYPKS